MMYPAEEREGKGRGWTARPILEFPAHANALHIGPRSWLAPDVSSITIGGKHTHVAKKKVFFRRRFRTET